MRKCWMKSGFLIAMARYQGRATMKKMRSPPKVRRLKISPHFRVIRRKEKMIKPGRTTPIGPLARTARPREAEKRIHPVRENPPCL